MLMEMKVVKRSFFIIFFFLLLLLNMLFLILKLSLSSHLRLWFVFPPPFPSIYLRTVCLFSLQKRKQTLSNGGEVFFQDGSTVCWIQQHSNHSKPGQAILFVRKHTEKRKKYKVDISGKRKKGSCDSGIDAAIFS